jgi:secondary thiamine-phosphate synthase enzyme
MWSQKEIKLDARPRGFHLITADILQHLPELKRIQIGMLNVFIKHTSASLTINENADPTVRQDFEYFLIKQCLKMIHPTDIPMKEVTICQAILKAVFSVPV